MQVSAVNFLLRRNVLSLKKRGRRWWEEKQAQKDDEECHRRLHRVAGPSGAGDYTGEAGERYPIFLIFEMVTGYLMFWKNREFRGKAY
jgi:hypothetical protein